VPGEARHVGAGAPLEAWIRAVQAIAPEDLVICRCEEVTCGDLLGVRPPRYLGATSPSFARRSLDTLLAGGPLNQDQVKRLTRAGMGACQGRRCREQVAALLALTARVPPDVPPMPTHRPPLRPLPLSVLQDEREPEAMREWWHPWFGIASQWTPPWELEHAERSTVRRTPQGD
jgi:BFD-like [2Fe-2S] binding domain